MELNHEQRLAIKDQLVARIRATPTHKIVEGREIISWLDPSFLQFVEKDRLDLIEEIESRYRELILG